MDDPIGSQLLIQLVLILVNAFFASTETAVVSLNENRIRKQAEDGDNAAVVMLKMIESPTRFLSTIQVCITLSGFLASAFAADNFASKLADAIVAAGFTLLSPALLNTICVVLITLVLSYFMIVLGELVPKRIVLRLLRINPDENTEEVTEEEIRMMVDIGSESGAIEQDERTMIENIFEFNNTTAADVMVHRIDVVALPTDADDEQIIQTIRESGKSRFPVYQGDIDNVVGILNLRDFLLNKQLKTPKTTRQLLRKPYLVPETIAADTLFSNMQKQKVHMAIVVDEYGGMSGIVTMEDLLEEIVGNIYDEFDNPAEDQELEVLGENLWRVNGTAELEMLSETLDVELPLEEEFDTLSGLVFSAFPRIPEDGSTPEVTLYGLHIQVESICDHRVEKALVSKVATEEAEKPEDQDRSDD